MVRLPDGGGSNESLDVTPQRLRDTAPQFHKASQDTADMLLSLNQTTQQLIADMLLLSALTRYTQALENFYERWRISMLCLSTALGRVGITLEEAAGDYVIADQWSSNLMKQTGNTMPNIPLIPGFTPPSTIPGLNGPPIINPGPGANPPPVVKPNPGINYPPIVINPGLDSSPSTLPTEGGFGIDNLEP